jgi:hypothetical protein
MFKSKKCSNLKIVETIKVQILKFCPNSKNIQIRKNSNLKKVQITKSQKKQSSKTFIPLKAALHAAAAQPTLVCCFGPSPYFWFGFFSRLKPVFRISVDFLNIL